MQFIKQLRNDFSSKLVSNEYKRVQESQTQNFFKVCMVTILVMTLSSFILSAIAKKEIEEIRLICMSVACVALWLLSYKLRKYLEYILILFSLVFCVGAFLFIKEKNIVPSMCYPAFFMGYIFGTYEKVITLKLPRIRFKLLFSLLLLVAKILIFPATKAVQIFSFVLQIVMVIFSLIADFLKEKKDRKTFQNFYDYRESLTKFKNLLVSGLSTNLLIISGDLKEELFSNECLHKTISEKAQADQTYIKTLHEWLRHLKVEKRSLSESVLDNLDLNESIPSVLELLKACSHQWFEGRDKNISFSAEYLDEKAQCIKIYEISITSIVWDAKDSIAIILNDITAHSQNQNLKIADSNKDKMLAMVSHELRTPINGILGVVRILQNQTKDPQTLQYLSICKSSGELLYNLVNSILDLQHLRDNKFSLKVVRYDLYELMRGVHDLFKFQFEEKNLYLNLEVDPLVPKFIATDQNRLRQILINLIGNALKFTFEGGVTISVDIDLETKESLKFSVSDSGIGINPFTVYDAPYASINLNETPFISILKKISELLNMPRTDQRVKDEDKAKLFKMYGRLDQENSMTNTQGVGFGLEISNRLCKLLADQSNQSGIQCESEFGKGTTFSFSIKDYNQSCQGDDDTQFFEPQTFAEATENLSMKLSPYSLLTGRSDRDATQSRMPLSVSRLNSSQHLLPASPTLTPKKNLLVSARTSLAYIHYQNQPPTKSKFQPLGSSNSMMTRSELFINSPGLPKRENDSPDQLEQFRLEGFPSVEIKEHRLKMTPVAEKHSILIIDDNSFNLLVAKHLLESLGYLVETALNGQLGIDMVKSFIAAKKNKFAAILMDLQMPVMDGFEATRVLKEMMGKNEIPDIPIIALSANDTEEDKIKCKKVGMHDHLSKPLKEEELRRLLAEVFDGSNSSFGSFGDVN